MEPIDDGYDEEWYGNNTPDKTITTSEIIKLVGVSRNSSGKVISRLGLTPIGRDAGSRENIYDRDKALAAIAARPGRGSPKATELYTCDRCGRTGWRDFGDPDSDGRRECTGRAACDLRRRRKVGRR